ncbi:MAG: hypothetical protein HY559_02290 [Gammaproteobacteria bacterium]|nr:hypothetical protein [Gammaproteobacteria bacterium]
MDKKFTCRTAVQAFLFLPFKKCAKHTTICLIGCLFAIAFALYTKEVVAVSLTDGHECTSSTQCSSGYCYPGPEEKSYCISRDANCAKPGTAGVMVGALYSYRGKEYICHSSGGLQKAEKVSFLDGFECTSSTQCSSGYCYPGPNQKNYCTAREQHCAYPQSAGTQIKTSYFHDKKLYFCSTVRGFSSSGMLGCGLTTTQMEKLYPYFQKGIKRWTDSFEVAANYPQVLYDMQTFTATVLYLAAYCGNLDMLDQLATLYLIPFSYLTEVGKEDSRWITPTGIPPTTETSSRFMYPFGYDREQFEPSTIEPSSTRDEEMLYSSQFIYPLAYLLRRLAELPSNNRTPAMHKYMTTATPLLRGTFNRWMNQPSMWTWTHCRFPSSRSNMKAYTFPEFVSGKLQRSLGSSWCNAMLEIELWVAAAVTEFLSANKRGMNLELTPQETNTLTTYAQTTLKLFESRLSEGISTSPLCGGRCSYLILDRYGMRGHPDQPDAASTWDISHGRRLVQFLETMYAPENTNITQPTKNGKWVKTQFANAIIYQIFNGSWDHPRFANFMDGVNVHYRSYEPFALSDQYADIGYAFWQRYNRDITELNSSFLSILEGKKSDSFYDHIRLKEGPEDFYKTVYHYLAFVASLSHPWRE